ncbi:hypothetical protein GGR52DRAFT_585771 [Hypoxylon sp. FL1284]|nr:hypothetical protein GGR52DRAFT_585771 [Hypoxylon sp. FL1284]
MDKPRHQDDEAGLRVVPRSRQDLLRLLRAHCGEVEPTIKRLAAFVLGSDYPVTVQWDLVRVAVELVGAGDDERFSFVPLPRTVDTMDRPTAAEERAGWLSGADDGYVACIRVGLPADVAPADARVARMRDALVYDEAGAFRFLPGVPFRAHPVYCAFGVQLTGDLSERDVCKPVWSLPSLVFLPVPETVREGGGDAVMYLQHNTRDAEGILRWQREMDREGKRRRVAKGVRYVWSEDVYEHGGWTVEG